MRRGWWEVLRAAEMLADVRQNCVGIINRVAILQTDDGQTQRPKKLLSPFVLAGRPLTVMRSSFKFNDQLFGGAVEVDDIGPDALLAAEFSAV